MRQNGILTDRRNYRRIFASWLVRRMTTTGRRRLDPVEVLPEEIMHLVWDKLDERSLAACSRVCVSWRWTLAEDNVWRRYCSPSEKVADSGRAKINWRTRYLDQKSLMHNWGHNKYFTYTKTPVNGKVEASEAMIYTWEDTYVTGMTVDCRVLKTLTFPTGERVTDVRWTGCALVIAVSVNGDCRIEICTEALDRIAELETSLPNAMDYGDRWIAYLEGGRLHCGELNAVGSGWNGDSITVPECRRVERILVTGGGGILARILDNNQETVHCLYRNGSWCVLNKIERTPLGERDFYELATEEYVLMVHWVRFEGIYLYSNVNLYRGGKMIAREIISNCRREYFSACFGRDTVIFSAADYRLVQVDMDTLRSREVYVKDGFTSLKRIQDRYLAVSYSDRIDVLDSGKVVYSIALASPSPVIRDTFLVTACSKLAGLRSLRVLSFRQPEYVDDVS